MAIRKPHPVDLFDTLLQLLTEEELLRLRKRVSLLRPDSKQGDDLIDAFSTELLYREILETSPVE